MDLLYILGCIYLLHFIIQYWEHCLSGVWCFLTLKRIIPSSFLTGRNLIIKLHWYSISIQDQSRCSSSIAGSVISTLFVSFIFLSCDVVLQILIVYSKDNSFRYFYFFNTLKLYNQTVCDMLTHNMMQRSESLSAAKVTSLERCFPTRQSEQYLFRGI